MNRRRTTGAFASMILMFALVASSDPAGADPAQGGSAEAFAATATLADQSVIPPTPESTVDAPPFGDDSDTSIPIDADPLAVNGTLISSAKVHQASDIATALEQPASAQAVPGPYNAQGVGQIEDLEVIVDAVSEGVPLVEADAVRGEAVAKCVGNTASYSANSEVVNLVIGGQDPLSGPLNDLVAQISGAINDSGLADLLDIDVNVTNVTATGASVDALVITVLEAAGDPPVAQGRLGHAEVSGVTCGAGGTGGPPQCSDTVDNDDDGVIDAADPGCHSDGDADNPDTYVPSDDDETDGGGPQCSDTVDNDGDGVIDADDPGCHSDGDADNPDSYEPDDDDEADTPQCSDGADNDGDGVIDAADPGCHSDGDATNPATYVADDNDEGDGDVLGNDALPKTGGTVPVALGLGLLVAAGAVELLRRRATV